MQGPPPERAQTTEYLNVIILDEDTKNDSVTNLCWLIHLSTQAAKGW
jgi:hypothetical protein